MMEDKNEPIQHLVVKNRSYLTIDAVESIKDFSDSLLVLATKYGDVFVEGTGMKILNLSEKEGTINVTGKINGFYFKEPKKIGFWSSLIK